MTQNQPPLSTNFTYRPDIDGLRAIAVLAVVLFHLGFATLEGGFLGVDIFFVISGYLITSIIAPKIALGTFSFLDFYLKRIRRLLPSALVTVTFTFLAAAFILDPADLIALAKSAIASVFSMSNILFFTETGYWDAQSELKPLLHTWSLGVEEQFYIFWPLLVMCFWKFGLKQNLMLAFAIVTLVGLFISEWMLRSNPSAAFYLLPARVFEFAIGASFAFFGKTAIWNKFNTPKFRFILGWCSLFVLLATIWLYKGHTPFPGLNGLLPCLATALLLLSGEGATETLGLSTLLGNSVMTWVGRISYSLYLVHWPVVSLIRYKVGLELHFIHQIIATAFIVALTLVLYYGVEQRISARAGQSRRDTSKPSPKNGRFAIGTGVMTLALSAVFAHAAFNSGWTWRFPNLSFTPEQVKKEKGRRFSTFVGSCVIMNFPSDKNCRSDAPLNVLVLGNSHEPDGFNFFQAGYGDDVDLQLIRFEEVNRCNFKSTNGIIRATGDGKDCNNRLARIHNPEIASKLDIVIYSSNRPFAANKLITLEILTGIKRANPDIKILSMGGYINNHTECFRLINATGTARTCVETKNVKNSPEQDLSDPTYPHFEAITDYYLDKGALLCTGEQPSTCESQTPDLVPFSYDEHHLSLDFAQYAGRKFAKQNPSLLRDLAGLPNK